MDMRSLVHRKYLVDDVLTSRAGHDELGLRAFCEALKGFCLVHLVSVLAFGVDSRQVRFFSRALLL